MTKTYIGVKIVEAEPQHKSLSTMPMVAGEEDVPGYAVRYADGYTSWSPKDVFEAAYREVPEDQAESIHGALQEGLGFMAAAKLIGGSWEFEECANEEAAKNLSIRFTALDIAAKMASAAPIQFGTEVLLNSASMIANWLETGNPDAIAEAEQRGYNAARPLDPETINIEPEKGR